MDVMEEASGGLEEAFDVQAGKIPISDGDGNIQNLSDDSNSNSSMRTMIFITTWTWTFTGFRFPVNPHRPVLFSV